MTAGPGISAGIQPVISNIAQILIKESIKQAGKAIIKKASGSNTTPNLKHANVVNLPTTTIKSTSTTTAATSTMAPYALLQLTTALAMVTGTVGSNNEVAITDTCTSAGIIQLEQSFQIIKKIGETLDLTQQAANMKAISEEATALIPQLRKGLTSTALTSSKKALAGTHFPQQYSWQELGTPRKMKGTDEEAIAQCLGKGGRLPPILSPFDLVDLGKMLNAHNMKHIYLQVDSLPGALTSPISGAQIAILPTAVTASFENNRLISYAYDATRKNWIVMPIEANKSLEYLCIFPSDARHTPGMANRMKGAMRGLTDNLEKYQSHYATFFKILNSAASVIGPTITASTPKSINSPVLTQILGNLNMLQLKNDWTKLGAQDYANIAKTGQLVGRYLTRHPTGPKAITINKDHKLQKFQPSHISGYKVEGTTFTKQGAEWVKKYRVQGFISQNDGTQVDVNRIVETGGTYYGLNSEVEKLQCSASMAGGEICAGINFIKTKQAEECGRAIMTNNGALHKCPRTTPSNVRLFIKPNCLELLHKQVVITSEKFDARMTCGTEGSKKMHIPAGTVITGYNCSVSGASSGQSSSTWDLQQAMEVDKGQDPVFIQTPASVYAIFGVKLQMKDIIIITLATISILVSLALGLVYLKHKKQEHETALQAYEREVAYQQKGYPIVNI